MMMRKWLCGFVALVLLAGGVAGTLPAAAEEPSVAGQMTLGDVNADGKVNTADARRILQYAAQMTELSSEQCFLGDVNADGKTNTADARQVLQYAANMPVTLGAYASLQPEETTTLLSMPGMVIELGDNAVLNSLQEWEAYCEETNASLAEWATLTLDAAQYDETFFDQHQLVIVGMQGTPLVSEAIRIDALYDNGAYLQPVVGYTATTSVTSSVLLALALPTGTSLCRSVVSSDAQILAPSATRGAPTLTCYTLDDPYAVDPMPNSDNKCYFIQQANSRAELEAAVAAMKAQTNAAWGEDFDAYLATYDETYFEDGAVVLMLRAEYASCAVKGLTVQEDGSLMLELYGMEFGRMVGGLTRPYLMAANIHKEDLGGRTVTAVSKTETVDLNSYLVNK